jgi:hypothetical protein
MERAPRIILYTNNLYTVKSRLSHRNNIMMPYCRPSSGFREHRQIRTKSHSLIIYDRLNNYSCRHDLLLSRLDANNNTSIRIPRKNTRCLQDITYLHCVWYLQVAVFDIIILYYLYSSQMLPVPI